MRRPWIILVGVLGCAEGALPEADAGSADMTTTNRPDVLTFEDVATDMDLPFVFGVECDPLAQDCEQGKCVPNPSTAKSTCLQLGEQRAIAQECDSITQCIKGAHCASLPNETSSFCRQMCDHNATESCALGTSCIATLPTHPEVGLCAGTPEACDIYANDCSSGDCVVARDSMTNAIGTFCGQAGTRQTSQTCGGAAGECSAGHICVQLANALTSTCQPVCRKPEDGTLRACPAGFSCTGTAASSGVTFCE